MTTSETSRFVRLRVDLVMEVTDSGALGGAALDRIAGDEFMPDDERARSQGAVRGDDAEALAHLVDPFDLVSAVPGVELAQASWSSELTDYDPDSPEWELGVDDDYEGESDLDDEVAGDDEGDVAAGGGGRL
ncbi:hypothetical protein [Streptomyces tsukubensis]|uniref:Uncharacterized protein n=1 Tax=Streptomyces tsukubensis TaxID=83656 RepID=A0A1V4AC94_9ACTN|nr:hypothetical protein [Streptomyces tsukubensis]OON81451.1 hypothetical protein B1H18_09080 [Streptomyces tsukubensis]